MVTLVNQGPPGYEPRVLNAWSQTKNPGALVTNLGSSNAWSQTKTPMPQAWLPWLQSRGPRESRVFKCLVPDQDSHAPGMVTLVAIQGP
jgi:hypothetical protein